MATPPNRLSRPYGAYARKRLPKEVKASAAHTPMGVKICGFCFQGLQGLEHNRTLLRLLKRLGIQA